MFVYAQLYYVKQLKTHNQMILFKTLTHSLAVIPQGSKHVGVFSGFI
jgi:hypothetical protein